MKRLVWATPIVPLVLATGFFATLPPLVVFIAGLLSVTVLALWMRRATEQLALRAGPTVGGLLNVSFGSVAEFILMLFVIASGHASVVRAQITGSIIGTSLLGLGLAALAGGWRRERQTFSKKRAGLLSSLFMIVVFALLLPAVVNYSDIVHGASVAQRTLSEETFSIGASAVLIVIYAGNLVFTLITHRDVFANATTEAATAEWNLVKSLGVLVIATLAVACCADLISGVLVASADALHLPVLFLGVVPLALVGTAPDLFAAVAFARDDKLDLVITISIGSAIQIGLVVAPMLVLVSWAIGKPMNLIFPSMLDLFAITGAAFIVNAISADGETNWFEGILLTGTYLLIALAFFFVAPA